MSIESLFILVIVIFSVMIHEVSHGYAAYFFGDQTAKYQGRLTLNPLKHIDLFGSIILPLILVLTQSGVMFGWAKPVPYNPYNLRRRELAERVIALAGPLSNLSLALVFSLIFRICLSYNLVSDQFLKLVVSIVMINVVLCVFNLIPIPPLDGSKILVSLLPEHLGRKILQMEWYGLFLVLIIVSVFGNYIAQITTALSRIFLGI